ncbi:MAG: histidinol dehydrogenase, partial [Desulfobacteraceae bacterium]|nr:histidinol dehydrogenase [Desulfobacteraceae bacterium]
MEILQYPSDRAEKKVLATIERGLGFTEDDYKNVNAYIEAVKTDGDKAVCNYTNQFDSKHVTEQTLKVSDDEFKEACKKLDQKFLKALDRAVVQIESFHLKQNQNSWIDTPREGVMLGQMVKPV